MVISIPSVNPALTYLDIELNHLLGIRIMLLLPFSLKDFQYQYLFVLLLILLAHAKNLIQLGHRNKSWETASGRPLKSGLQLARIFSGFSVLVFVSEKTSSLTETVSVLSAEKWLP